MALWSLDIEKKLPSGITWSNRYILDDTGGSDLTIPAGEIVAAERAIHSNLVTFTKYRVSSMLVDDDAYIIVPLGLLGLRNTGAVELMPLFVVARVDFQVPQGRPSRKYLRGVLHEGDVAITELTQAALDFIQNNYATVVAAVSAYVDVDGQSIQTGAAQKPVAMRQLRRGSKRTQPIIP